MQVYNNCYYEICISFQSANFGNIYIFILSPGICESVLRYAWVYLRFPFSGALFCS